MARKESNSIHKYLIIKDIMKFIIDSCPHSCPCHIALHGLLRPKLIIASASYQKSFEMVLYQRAAAEKSTP
jgi:hypothetical protein